MRLISDAPLKNKQPRMSWGNSYRSVGTVPLPDLPPQMRSEKRQCHPDGQDFDAIFRQLVACYNAASEIERQIAVEWLCLINAPPPREKAA